MGRNVSTCLKIGRIWHCEPSFFTYLSKRQQRDSEDQAVFAFESRVPDTLVDEAQSLHGVGKGVSGGLRSGEGVMLAR